MSISTCTICTGAFEKLEVIMLLSGGCCICNYKIRDCSLSLHFNFYVIIYNLNQDLKYFLTSIIPKFFEVVELIKH